MTLHDHLAGPRTHVRGLTEAEPTGSDQTDVECCT
ncbi:hypothetical protein Sked_22430 [Sanguibacter keddieii DSM 10542]|uniref:Uncharacterized protein n=1 Tax=Sanguibacter keddieii (strain ATCC 51767 / DSM 10542 / NCFB 3025 / ST-74) TaxID=446469 RepID=D1BII1_SANKS|nr:hypothetical protein Sked_22430 [Sanguibacter keddieii DSM 10542]